ncbi:MAG: molybdopterin biosynthesis protein [Proteobacteria bacterium]|nr:MAG: molybdopterin biosynthesis protein [Pseudomonadota bacterium]
MTEAKSLIQRRHAARQRQFLDTLDAEAAAREFRRHLPSGPLGIEDVALRDALSRVVAETIVSKVDVPGFDRTNVDGFAVRSVDTAAASEDTPRYLAMTDEVVTPGVVPTRTVEAGEATLVATGAIVPRGADAIVMVEDTELDESADAPRIEVRRPVAAGAYVTFAGTDIGLGETVIRAGHKLTSREIGLLAAIGLDTVPVFRKPRVAVISTGDEIVPPGQPLPVGGIYDSNQAIVSAAVEELGGEACPMGVVPDDRQALDDIIARALDKDMVILSGGTSKGAGDMCYEAVGALPAPGVVVHGVAIKPGKPLCLAVAGDTPVVILPGFPTSAIFTFHRFVAPVLRGFAGLGEAERIELPASLAVRVASDPGRTEFLLVNLVSKDDGYAAYPIEKGSGAVSSFSQADGFVTIDAGRERVPAGTPVRVQLLSSRLEAADLIAIGSHCVGLDVMLGRMQREGFSTKAMHVGSMGGIAAARRGECDVGGIHLMDPDTGEYNRPFLEPGMELVKGYRRLQGFVFRDGDSRFAQCSTVSDAVAAALLDPKCVMVNRNAGSGTRVLIDELLGNSRPSGYAHQTKSHNAVAAAVGQGRADWGIAIDTVARSYGLGFLPLKEEHYDFVVPTSRIERPAVRRFIEILNDDETRRALRDKGFHLSPR